MFADLSLHHIPTRGSTGILPYSGIERRQPVAACGRTQTYTGSSTTPMRCTLRQSAPIEPTAEFEALGAKILVLGAYERPTAAWNAKSGQTRADLYLSFIGDRGESRVNAQGPTSTPNNQKTSSCRSQAGQKASEAGIRGVGRKQGKGEEGQSEGRKGQDREREKGLSRPHRSLAGKTRI